MATKATKKQQMDLEKLAQLGTRLRGTWQQYQSERIQPEQRWLDALLQYRGKYAEGVIIPPGRSAAYPKVTRAKCVSAQARLMSMLFPSEERNWGVQPPKVPNLDPVALQAILTKLQMNGEPLTKEMVEQAIYRFAQKRSERMADTIEAQLEESRYEAVVRKVVRSAIVYGTGVARGPFVIPGTTNQIVKDPVSQQWMVQPTSVFRPRFEFVQIWDFFPDLSANSWDGVQNVFFRHTMTRHDFRQLANRPDFLAKNITKWLRDNPEGNYDPMYYRTYMKAMGYATMPSGAKNRIEVMEYWGQISAQNLSDVGIETPPGSDGELAVNIWLVGDTVIKVVLNPYEAIQKPYHIFTYEEDDTAILGNGIPWIIEDSQRAICAATRMMLDNASVTTGPIFEVNTDLLVPSGAEDLLEIKPFKVFERESGGDATASAVQQIPVQNHVPDLINIIEGMKQNATEETAISGSAIGDSEPSQESLRTSSGIAMLMGASLIQIRDTVKNFDEFTRSIIRSMVDWNNQFNEDESIKGDHEVIARGSTALVAREVRMAALDAFATTLQPEDAVFVDRKALLRERLKLHELPLDTILKSDEEIEQAQQQAQQQTQEQQQLALDKVKAEIQMQLSTAFMNIAKGDAAANQAQAQFYESVMNTLGAMNGQPQGAQPTPSPAVPAGSPLGVPTGPAVPGVQVLPQSSPGTGSPLPTGNPGPIPGGAAPTQGAGLPGLAQSLGAP